MTTNEASTTGAAWDELRRATDALRALIEAPHADLIALGKAYAGVAHAMVGCAAAAGQTSMRFQAAAKALDLRTSKSALREFVESGG